VLSLWVLFATIKWEDRTNWTFVQAVQSLGILGLAIGCILAPESSVHLLVPCLSLLTALSLQTKPLNRQGEALFLGSLVVACGGLILALLPRAWLFIHHVVGIVSQNITSLLGAPLRLGPSALALGSAALVMTIITIAGWCPRTVSEWRRIGIGLAIPVLVILGQCLAMGVVARDGSMRVEPAWKVGIVLNLLATLAILGSGMYALTRRGPEYALPWVSRYTSPALAGLVITVLVGTAHWSSIGRLPGDVLVAIPPPALDPLMSYQTVPAAPQPLHEVGMFGEWPRRLQQLGYPTRLHVGLPKADELENVRIVCLFAPSATWAGHTPAILALQEFVNRGGSLLIFAEHTNYQTSALVLNHLLEPFGIRINFDTTNGGFGEDLRGVRLWHSELRPIVRALAAFPYNRGASLTLKGNAVPLLVGQFWQGDVGSFLAEDQSFLGDFRVGPGDSWGDVILAAEWHGPAGGRIVVFGDTTPFMNTALGYTGPAITPLLEWLARPAISSTWVVGLMSGVAVFGGLLIWGRSHIQANGEAALVVIAMVAVLCSLLESRRVPLPFPSTVPTLLVTTDLLNQLDLNVYGDRAPTALMVEAIRAGFVPGALSVDALGVSRPTVVVWASPRRPISAQELADVFRWVEAGTTLIVTADGSVPPARAVLHQLGLTMAPLPLGNIVLESPTGETVQLQSAWALQLSEAWTARSSYRTSPVIAERRIGRGRLIVIADEGIVTNTSLATERTVIPSNLLWWRALLHEVQRGS
jgi:hypothetical protein